MTLLKHTLSVLFAFMFLFAISSCEKEEDAVAQNKLAGPDISLQTRSVEPVFAEDFQSGDAESECAQSSCDGDYAWKIDEAPEGVYTINSEEFDNLPTAFEGMFTVTETDGTYFSWTTDMQICAIIVKGGPDANIYYLDDQCEGFDFHAPINPNNGNPYGLSHVTLCFFAAACGNQPEYCVQEETAWVNNTEENNRYTNRGSWARYIAPVWEGDGSGYFEYEILAGQNYVAGEAILDSDGDIVTVTLNLYDGWVFYYDAGDPEGDDNVKAQGYDGAPHGNPKIGKFDTKHRVDAGATSFTFEMDVFDYYGIHLDVGMPVDCD